MRNKINILHVTANLHSGGVQHLLAKSLAIIDRENFNHYVCCISEGGFYEAEIQSIGISCWIMNRHHRFDPSIITQLGQLMRRLQIDIVHTINFTANTWGRLAAKIAGISTIIAHERGTAWTENGTMRFVDRLLYPVTDLLIANSQAAYTILTQHVGLSANRLRVIYNGLPENPSNYQTSHLLRHQIGLKTDHLIVGTLGRLDTPKGIQFLIKIIPKIVKIFPKINFVIVGDGPLSDYYKLLAQSMGLFDQNLVSFLGFIPNASTVLSEFDILVQPSIREPLGNSIIEAGLNGCPVVASNVDGCPEVIEHEKTGLLVNCNHPVTKLMAPGASPLPKVVVDGETRTLRPPLGPNPNDLAQAIVRLCSNAELRHLMGTNARQRTQRLFSLERYVLDLENIYRGSIL
ncbi:MAG: glycosyltransferase [Anaerolineales bacterium]|nr:glycosyltransferase [Anaerolineales bacterium]